MDALRPGDMDKEGEKQSQQSGGDDHHGGVDPGELGDEVLSLGLFAAGVLHQVQDSGHRGLLKGLGDLDPQQAGQVDAAADDVAARIHLTGEGLTGEGGGV